MEQTEIKLHILYFLVAIIVTCETRFRHLGQTYNTGGGYGDGPASSHPQRDKTYNEGYPNNIPTNGAPLNGAPLNGEYFTGRYTNLLPVNTGNIVSNRGSQIEISPYSSNQVSPGRFISNYPPGFIQTVNKDGGSVLYDKSSFVSPGMGYANPTKIPEKVRMDHRYPLYDGSQVVHPYDEQNRMNIYNRSPYHNKFTSPSSGQTSMNLHPEPYGGTSGWSMNRPAANKEETSAYDGYLGVRSFRHNSTVHEGGDLTAQDSFAMYDNIPNGVPTDYLIVKNRILADYNFL